MKSTNVLPNNWNKGSLRTKITKKILTELKQIEAIKIHKI